MARSVRKPTAPKETLPPTPAMQATPATASEALERLTRIARSLFPDDPSVPGIIVSYLGEGEGEGEEAKEGFYASLVRFQHAGGKGKIVVLATRHASLLEAINTLSIKVDVAMESGKDESGRVFQGAVKKLHNLSAQERRQSRMQTLAGTAISAAIGGMVSAITQRAAQQILASTPPPIYVDPVRGDDSNDGSSPGTAFRSFLRATDGVDYGVWGLGGLRTYDVRDVPSHTIFVNRADGSLWQLVRRTSPPEHVYDGRPAVEGETFVQAHESATPADAARSVHSYMRAYWILNLRPGDSLDAVRGPYVYTDAELQALDVTDMADTSRVRVNSTHQVWQLARYSASEAPAVDGRTRIAARQADDHPSQRRAYWELYNGLIGSQTP